MYGIKLILEENDMNINKLIFKANKYTHFNHNILNLCFTEKKIKKEKDTGVVLQQS